MLVNIYCIFLCFSFDELTTYEAVTNENSVMMLAILHIPNFKMQFVSPLLNYAADLWGFKLLMPSRIQLFQGAHRFAPNYDDSIRHGLGSRISTTKM